jgi:diaminopimelate decarboxylase
MTGFHCRNNVWYVDGLPLARVAERVGTPAYVYSQSHFTERFREVDRAYASVPHLVAYSLKANANLALVRSVALRGAGADVVSGGELYKARRAGIPASRIIYAGVGKTDPEIRYALEEGIRYFNVESLPEMEAIDAMAARMGKVAPVAVRFNPDVDALTHRHINTGRKESKFGISIADVDAVVAASRRCSHVRFTGVHAHLGSQMTSVEPMRKALGLLEHLVQYLRREGVPVTTLNLGGGYGIHYDGERPPSASAWARRVVPVARRLHAYLIVEPGRYISGNSGALLARVVYVKRSHGRTFVLLDAGMNDLIRPALYDAVHRIVPVRPRKGPKVRVDVAGPICESSDFFAKNLVLPPLERGDGVAILTAGAYGSTMASQYNGRPFAPEVLVKGSRMAVVRRRQRIDELAALERIAPL